jgi:hypothetical protein
MVLNRRFQFKKIAESCPQKVVLKRSDNYPDIGGMRERHSEYLIPHPWASDKLHSTDVEAVIN